VSDNMLCPALVELKLVIKLYTMMAVAIRIKKIWISIFI
jgi:hypothetical protein